MRQTATNRNKSETKPTTQTTINKKFPSCRNAKCLHIANNMLYTIYIRITRMHTQPDKQINILYRFRSKYSFIRISDKTTHITEN